MRRKCFEGEEREREKKRADDNGKSRKSVGCGSDPIGRKSYPKRKKKNPEANQICWNLLLLLFGIEGSRRNEEKRGGQGLDS